MAEDVVRALAVPDAGSTAFVQVLGHKADLMFICFRRGFEQLAEAQLAVAGTELHAALEPTSSYVSVVELGMYEMTAKLHEQLAARHTPGSDEFERAFDGEMETQRQRVMSRLFLDLPKARHVCFYPMNKRRGETLNWYSESFERRAAMMREHGLIGRTYAGKVTQIISGSIGYDDWEWGVDLFAEDPLVFKKLIYEMRFDEASAKFAEFGPFYTGLQFAPTHLSAFLNGAVPEL
jgi:chlorite dismutase